MRALLLLTVFYVSLSGMSRDTAQLKNQHFFTTSASLVYATDGFHWGGLLLDLCRNSYAWNKKNTTGMFNYGVAGVYQLRSLDQFPENLSGASVKGYGHRLGAYLDGEFLVLIPPQKHILFGCGVFAGWYEVIMNGALTNSALGIDDEYRAKKGALSAGFLFKPGYRINDQLSITITGILPIPFFEYEIPGLFTVGLGLQIAL
jgi:hypothetical protein